MKFPISFEEHMMLSDLEISIENIDDELKLLENISKHTNHQYDFSDVSLALRLLKAEKDRCREYICNLQQDAF